jgi:hypothetical protein
MSLKEELNLRREELILSYIKKHPGCTQTQVIDSMKGRSSLVTTHKIIRNLLRNEQIVRRIDEKNSLIRHLFINEKNMFNKIRNQLSEIEPFIDIMNRHLVNRAIDDNVEIGQLRDKSDEKKEKMLLQSISHFNVLGSIYRRSVGRMLEDLFHVTTQAKLSDKDTMLFHNKIVELKSRLDFPAWTIHNESNYLQADIIAIKEEVGLMKKNGLQRYAELAFPLIERIDNFKKDILS